MNWPQWTDPRNLMAARLRSFRNRLRAGYRGSLRQRELEAGNRIARAVDASNAAIVSAERDKSTWLTQAQADFERALGVLAECRFEREVGCGTERVLTVRLAVSQEALFRSRMDDMLPMFAQMLARMVEKEVLKRGDEVTRGESPFWDLYAAWCKAGKPVVSGTNRCDMSRATPEQPR